jgi:hypothetical protein
MLEGLFPLVGTVALGIGMRVQTTKVALTLLTFPFTIYGAVNMKDASFQSTYIDENVIARHYNSRSLHNGVFGFGWCSSLETTYNSDCPAPEEEAKDKLRRTYDGQGRVVSFKFLDGTVWKIHYNKESKVRQISSGRTSIYYEYHDQNLVEVLKGNVRLQKFAYDELNNLVEIESGKQREKLKYDGPHDWIIEYNRKDGCIEKFKYERSDPFSGPKETALAEIKCGMKIDLITYEFFYHQHSDGVNLAMVRSTAGNLIKTITLERGI